MDAACSGPVNSGTIRAPGSSNGAAGCRALAFLRTMSAATGRATRRGRCRVSERTG